MSALTQGIGLSLGVFVPILVSCTIFCIVYLLSSHNKVNSRNGPLLTTHQFQHPTGCPEEVHVDMQYNGSAHIDQSRAEAAPPSYREALFSVEPPSYDAVQEHKDLYTDVSLPPAYPGLPELTHSPLPSFTQTEESV